MLSLKCSCTVNDLGLSFSGFCWCVLPFNKEPRTDIFLLCGGPCQASCQRFIPLLRCGGHVLMPLQISMSTVS